MIRPLLGVNIDHVATVRQARQSLYPQPVAAALVAERAGADSITIHLREDRRHIIDSDVEVLAQVLETRMNLEMACIPEMLALAERIQPHSCCLVPERRAEVTTEGGLDVVTHEGELKAACRRLQAVGVAVSLFIDPEAKHIEAAVRCGANIVELHTGAYCDARGEAQEHELARLQAAAAMAHERGLQVNAGHGLHYHNVQAIAAIPQIVEFNIGHSIIARAIFDGLDEAVRTMKQLLITSRQ
jgi:pyridoxine 5-phosphate synthase